ncbi:MAG: hypothetical protein ACJAQ6_001766, partial [Arenicella sp.]
MSLNRTSKAEAEQRELKYFASLLIGKVCAEPPIKPGALLAKLDYHGITLLAAEQQSLPSALSSQLAQRKAMMVANDKLKQIELALLFDRFSEQNLNAVLFKGSALAYTIYAKPWLRPRTDNDVLIAPADRLKFDAVLQQLGYRRLFAMQGDYVSYQSTYGKALVGDCFMDIDLHWQINNRQMFCNTFTVKELSNNGRRLSQFGATRLHRSAVIPSNVDSVLIASVHRLGHHHQEERLAWLYDIHLLLRSFSKQDWQQLANRAGHKQISAITLDALKTTNLHLNTELDDSAILQLESSALMPEVSSIFLNRKLSERHYFWADLKSMSTLKSQLGFLRESVLPSPDYVRQQMNSRWA